jgi:hypothetical protein
MSCFATQSPHADVGDSAVVEPDEDNAVANGDDAAVATGLQTHAKGPTVGRPHTLQANAKTWPRGADRHVSHGTGDERDRDVAARDRHDARTLCAPERSRSSGDRHKKEAKLHGKLRRATGRLAIATTRGRDRTASRARLAAGEVSGAAHPDEAHIAELDANIIPKYHQRVHLVKVQRGCAGRRLSRAAKHKAQPRREWIKPGFAERHRAGR